MTLHRLAIEPRDVVAGSLGLVVGTSSARPLAEATVTDGRGRRIVLGVLGASHVVRAGEVLEEVSCDALGLGGEPLPATRRSGNYRFASDVRRADSAGFRRTAAMLRDRAADDGWLCGVFPGCETALTALAASFGDDGSMYWRTWHLYPDGSGGEIVTTASRVGESREAA
ncbi:DUF2617 family protein [Rhodococcus rhodnii]|uniref:DUF2617 domain-containing protein n=2 Tax=Rhodococcus rhodnii TaxID=38312 RepID=R7WR92_9NOCA|nr:DUF2617 family protein [Rhodococcus rhodnii]EOM77816.1 hypothetical protein Rrhod_0802 [Rhodococcus rhodnii LMG 5362]TXG88991.1 DUF2617 family protein [Rhodococcus rhodnii]